MRAYIITLAALVPAALMLYATGCGGDDCTQTLTCKRSDNAGGSNTGGEATSNGGAGGGTNVGGTGQGAGTQGGGGAGSLPDGASCTDENLCTSGFCVDGVCCESACDAECESCAAAGNEGTCNLHAANTDPDDECAQAYCDGAGECAFAEHEWSGSFNLVGFDDGDVDPAGNSYLASGLNNDVVVTRVSPNGNLLWTNSWGDSEGQYTRAVAARPGGEAVVCGYGYGTLDFGGTTTPLTALGAFVAVISSSGNGVWAKGFNSTGAMNPHSIAASAGDVVLGGASTGSVNFGGSTLVATGTDGFFAKFSSSGVHLESKLLDSSGGIGVYGTAVNANGEVALIGRFIGTMTLGATVLTSSPSNEYDIFITKLDAAGSYVWARRLVADVPNALYPNLEVDIDEAGAVLASGQFFTSIDLGSGPVDATDGDDAFVALLAPSNGTTTWFKTFGGSGDDTAVAAFDSTGYVLLTGRIQDAVDLGGGSLAAGPADVLVAKLDADGNHLWSRLFGDAQYQDGNWIGSDSVGDVYVGGTNQGTFSFGGTNVNSADGTTFVTRLGP